jgi:hypothetical protein
VSWGGALDLSESTHVEVSALPNRLMNLAIVHYHCAARIYNLKYAIVRHHFRIQPQAVHYGIGIREIQIPGHRHMRKPQWQVVVVGDL